MSAYICEPGLCKSLALFATECGNLGLFLDPRILHHATMPKAIKTTAEGGAALGTAERAEVATFYADALYQENVRSVKARYPRVAWDKLPGPVVKPLAVTVTEADVKAWDEGPRWTPVELLKYADCLEYQSSETLDYRQSLAWEILQQFRAVAWKHLPGYADAPWEYADPSVTEPRQSGEAPCQN